MRELQTLARQAGKLGGGSRSQSRQETENIQEIETRNLALSDTEGITVGAGDDVDLEVRTETRIEIEDSEAIAAAEEISEGALRLAGDVSAEAIRATGDTTREALDFGTGIADDIFEFGVDSLGAVTRTSEQAIASSQRSLGQALDFGGRTIESTQRTLADTFRTATGALGGAITKAADASRSDSAIVLNNAVKFGALAVAGIALFTIFSRR